LLWHLLACTESPMAFSPNGKSLAFVTIEPYAGEEALVPGPYCYRLMVAGDQKNLRVIEQTTDAMLTTPAYSPDGSQLCYVRFPLLSKAQLQRLEKDATEAQKRWQEGTRSAATAPAPGPATSQASSMPATAEDAWHTDPITLPDVEKTMELVKKATTNKPVKAELVIRQVSDYSVLKTVPLDLRGMRWNSSKELPDIFLAYLTLRPQFSPDGQWIYLCAGEVLMAVNPDRMTQRVLAAPANSAALSPDGQTVAFLQEPAIGLMRTDGSKATYVRWNAAPSFSGLAWVDNNTLAILSQGTPDASGKNAAPTTAKASQPLTITFMRTDGTILPSPRITLPVKADNGADKMGELAVSNDGRHMVVSFQNKVYFLDGKGRVVKLIETADKAASQPEHERGFVQPTFSPDSSVVAFKRLVGERGAARFGADAIVFFDPDGKELSRVAIPAIKPGTTRPADDSTHP
jgi:hypothetical protein